MSFEARNSDSPVIFFFKDDNVDQKSITKALCALLHQALRTGYYTSTLRKAVDTYKTHGAAMCESFQLLWNLLLDIANKLGSYETICILDALDECEELGKYKLINRLNSFSSSEAGRSGKLKFLVTSRPYSSIEDSFSDSIVRLAGEDKTELIKQEIDLVIKNQVPRLATMLKLTPEVEDVLLQKLLSMKHRTYLWSHLVLEEIRRQSLMVKTPNRMSSFLDNLPKTIYAFYEHLLEQSPDADNARELLHIILAAVRPLTMREMNLALNIKEGNKCRADVDLIPKQNFALYIKNVCGLFVTIYESRVYLLHQTAKEFLLPPKNASQRDMQKNPHSETWMYSFDPVTSDLVLARICLTYLLFDEFEKQPFCTEGAQVITNVEGSECFETNNMQPIFMDYNPNLTGLMRNESRVPHLIDQALEYVKHHEFLDYCSR